MGSEEAILLPSAVVRNLPAMVRNQLSKMDATRQDEFLEEYNRKDKSTAVAYIAWLFGLHYAYLGKWGMLVLFWITFAGLGFWWLVDVVRTKGMVADHNKDAATEVLRNMKSMSA